MAVHAGQPRSVARLARQTDRSTQPTLITVITTPQVNVPWPTMHAGTAGKEDTTFIFSASRRHPCSPTFPWALDSTRLSVSIADGLVQQVVMSS